MYHCPDCGTEWNAAERVPSPAQALYLEMEYYNCPGCGHQFLHRIKEYAAQDPSDEWYHLVEGKMLLVHHPPQC